MKIAVIAAAGWKGCSSCFPELEPGTPEPLLPLGNGETLLSRQARQLRELGFRVFAAIGRPGCTYPWWGNHTHQRGFITLEGAKQGIDSSPWTWERVDYVTRHATPIMIPDPDTLSRHGTNCLCIEALGLWSWSQLLLTSGDHLCTDELLRFVVEYPSPCQVLGHGHGWFSLDATAASVYLAVAHRHRGGRAKQIFDMVAPPVKLLDVYPSYREEFLDVDVAKEYRLALQWIKAHA